MSERVGNSESPFRGHSESEHVKQERVKQQHVELEQITQDQFLPRLVHDLTSPTHNLATMLDMLAGELDEHRLSASTAELLNMCSHLGAELVAILQALRKHVRLTSESEFSSVSLYEVITSCWQELGAKSGIAFVVERFNTKDETNQNSTPSAHASADSAATLQLIGNDRCVWADRSKLRSGLEEILANASRFRSPERPLYVVIEIVQVDGELLLTISDNGTGMSPQTLGKCKKPFEQAAPKPLPRGVGLGLTTAVVAFLHIHGNVEIESVSGKGTRVTISLPENYAGQPVDDRAT